MKKNQVILFFFYILVTNLASCQNESVKPEAWLRYPKSKVPQILLTNRSSFNKYGSSGGASGFLVEYNGKILAITAKHLTQEAGGFDPPIPTDSINITKNQWVMHPRTLKNDSVVLGRLLNDKPDSTDALAFEVDKPNPKIYPLKVSSREVKKGDTLMIIGCPYSERNCKQDFYAAFVFLIEKTSSKHLIFALTDSISLSGFSGAPVVDMNGFVVGILCGGGSESGDHFIYMHSINFLKSIADNKE